MEVYNVCITCQLVLQYLLMTVEESFNIRTMQKRIYREIGVRIKSLRQALKLTQAEVAEKAGIDASFYGQLERGTSIPSLRTLFSIADVLRVEPAELLPRAKGKAGKDLLIVEALDTMISKLKPGKRRFLMSVVRDLADELER